MRMNKFYSSTLWIAILWKCLNLFVVLGDKGSSDLHDSPTDHQHEHMGPILTETTTRANIANDDVRHEKTPKVISFVYDSFLRDIYQHASYNKKKHKASAGFAIYFIAIYESSCDCSADLLSKVEQAAELLEKHFQKFQEYTSLESPVTLPMVGEVDVRDAIKNSDLQALFDIDDLPVLKMVLVEQEQNESDKERGESESFSTEEGKYVPSDSNIHSLDYVGKKSTAQDIFETILHYWYRFVIAQETEFSAFDKMLQVNSTLENEDVILNQMSGKPIFTVTSMQEMTSFLNLHDPYMFRPIHQDYFGMSPREEYFVHSLMKDALVNEPYYAFVQCRSYENSVLSDQTLSLYESYEELALLYIHRKDVAFFAFVSHHSCDWMIDDNDYHEMIQTDDPMENDSNGIVRILAISHHFNATDVNVERNWIPQAYFHSSLFKKIYQPASTNDIMSFNLTDFAIVHTTPSILWLDRKTTATIAFPTYREIHFVLFIDVHSPRRKDGSFDYDSKSFQQSKHAIDLLYHASQQHRSLRPLDDVVFLIVPSTDVQILKTFGVDIWSDMDRRCSERMTTKAKTECFVDDIPQLPSAMITSRRESSKYMKVYHLELDKKSLSNHHPLHLGKAPIPTSNPLSAFLQTYFDNRNALKPTIKSEYIDISHETTSSGIKIATANTFDSMVLSPNKHSIVYLYTPTCGHCKRFHIIWKNFSLMIDKMNWRNQLDVITMDISKNDLFVELSVDHVPSVLFFRRGAKDRPEEMILEEDAIEGRGDKRMDHNLGGLSDAKDIVEWVLRMLGSEELQEWKRQTLIQLEKEKHDDLEEQEVNYAKGDIRQKSR